MARDAHAYVRGSARTASPFGLLIPPGRSNAQAGYASERVGSNDRELLVGRYTAPSWSA